MDGAELDAPRVPPPVPRLDTPAVARAELTRDVVLLEAPPLVGLVACALDAVVARREELAVGFVGCAEDVRLLEELAPGLVGALDVERLEELAVGFVGALDAERLEEDARAIELRDDAELRADVERLVRDEEDPQNCGLGRQYPSVANGP